MYLQVVEDGPLAYRQIEDDTLILFNSSVSLCGLFSVNNALLNRDFLTTEMSRPVLDHLPQRTWGVIMVTHASVGTPRTRFISRSKAREAGKVRARQRECGSVSPLPCLPHRGDQCRRCGHHWPPARSACGIMACHLSRQGWRRLQVYRQRRLLLLW
jgi:hypothetical protein